jgi:hypothetical protein
MSFLINAISPLLPLLPLLILFFLWKRRDGRAGSVPPLDLADAKKVDEMVSKQVEAALKPLLQADSYTEDQIQQILTRTSAGTRVFRR